jgi:hypothetical protein
MRDQQSGFSALYDHLVAFRDDESEFHEGILRGKNATAVPDQHSGCESFL